MEQVLERIAQVLRLDSQAAVREFLGVSAETVRTWRKRGQIPSAKLVRVAETAGVAISSLKTPPVFFGHSEKQVTQEVEASYGPAIDLQVYFPVPHLNVKTSAGNGHHVGHEEEVGMFAFRRDWIAKRDLQAGQLKVITARGFSMEPTIRDGDLLLVDVRPQSRLTEGIFIIDYDGESRCKRLTKLVTGDLKIASDNPAYAPEVVKKDALDLVRVVARVVWVGGER